MREEYVSQPIQVFRSQKLKHKIYVTFLAIVGGMKVYILALHCFHIDCAYPMHT